MGQIRVVVADDDETIRTVLSELVGSDPRFDVVGSAADGHELLDVVTRLEPHVVLLDVRMPWGGATAARALLEDHSVVVVAVSAETSPETVASLVTAGVRGYLAKGRLGPDLPDLVARCVAGEVILAVPTAAQAMRRLIDPAYRPGSP